MKKRGSLKGLRWLRILALPLSILCASSSVATAQNPLTLSESRGKQIYVQGTSRSGKDILAYVGDESIEVPGSAMACANCHGFDGQGKPEGGVSPSDITWEALTKPYGAVHADGRRHPAYSERGLELAISRGRDPAGNKFLNVMPRYQMSQEDLADLILYLKRLGKDRDPGISEDKIVIGTAIPATGPFAEMGQAVKAVTIAFFAELNSQGGIYNRHVELKFSETAETPAATRANLERFLKDEQIFALTGTFIAGAEKEIVPLLAQQEVPLIGPLTLNPQIGFPLNRQVFYLLSGSSGQARALISFIAGKTEPKSPAISVVYSRSEMNTNVLEAIKDQSTKDALGPPQVFDYGAGQFDAVATIKQLRQTSPDVVFFMGSTQELLSFMNEAEKLRWSPKVFLPGGAAGAEIFDAPVSFDGKVFFSFPTSPADQTAEGIKEFRALAEKYKLPSRHLAAQISAYSAAKILVEALKRVGKDLSREKLIQTLEGLYEYPSGLTPAITYGPNRRIGAMGAYVVTIDLKGKQFVPVGGWVSID